MIQEYLLIILIFLLIILLLVMIGQKIKIAYPIFLVIGGLLIGFIPGVPYININPDLIFLIFLPPLLYEAAWFTSWHDFWKWKRPIVMLAFGLVIFTSVIVAFVSVSLIPGFTLALGFLLGGIVSPPDAVAAASILKNFKVPKRILTILQGESLVNDASSLIVFRFAVAAVVSGTFVLEKAVSQFFLVTLLGIVTGVAIAAVIYYIHLKLPTTPAIDVTLTLMSPYFMYIVAEHFHFSGVMAVVSGGLFLSYRSHRILNFKSRLQAVGLWSTLIFILNGIVFILIGLELPVILDGIGSEGMFDAVKYGLIISLVVILIRFIWMYPAAFLPRFLSKRIRDNEASPGWKGPIIVSIAGMRGVVSLASALSIPMLTNAGESFPFRNLILFITFIVIIITLVVQGLALPYIINLLGLKEIDNLVPEEEQETGLQLLLKQKALETLNSKYAKQASENELLENLKKELVSDIEFSRQRLQSLEYDQCGKEELEVYNNVMKDILDLQREELFTIRKNNLFDDEVIRRQESQLDIEEARISKQGE